MIKTTLLFLASSLIAFSKQGCHKQKTASTNCLKGRLEIKGICANYTIKVLEGNVDTSMIVTQWTDEQTGKSYSNVFALGSRCNFPDSIQQGQEFYFTIDSNYVQRCMVCMAYYPTPSKKLAIKVLPGSCK